ncbi:hypothetical protein LguiA_018039 [Lonicera macranthoides]
MEEITERWKKFLFSAEEKEVSHVMLPEGTKTDDVMRNCLVGRLCDPKSVNQEAFKNMMMQLQFMLEFLGGKIGEVVTVLEEQSNDGVVVFSRFRIRIMVSKPLRIGIRVQIGEERGIGRARGVEFGSEEKMAMPRTYNQWGRLLGSG